MDGMHPKLRPLTRIVFSIFAGLPLTSQADQIAVTYTLDAQYILNGTSGTPVDGTAVPDAVQLSGNGASYLASPTESYASLFLHTYGSDNAVWGSGFGANVSGAGTFFAKTSLAYHALLTNTSSTTQSLLFDFNLGGGQLGFLASGSGIADLLLRIRVNGIDYSWDHTSMAILNDVTTCSSDDFGVLANYMECGAPGAGLVSSLGESYSLNLGQVSALDSVTIDYDIVATISGEMWGPGSTTHDEWMCDSWDSGTGGQQNPICLSGHWVAVTDFSDYGGAVANVAGVARASLAPTGNPIPEPASLALLGLGFAGLLATRRRRIICC